MERGFKYRIYPNASQRDQIARTLGCCRFVYNRALDVKKSAYAKTGKTVSWAELSRMLPAWKRDSETSWLAQADSMAQSVDSQDDELPFTYFRPIRDRLYSWGFDAIKDAQAVMYLGRGDYDSYQIARNDLEDSGWLSPEIEINSLDKIPLGEYLQAGISKMKSTDWA